MAFFCISLKNGNRFFWLYSNALLNSFHFRSFAFSDDFRQFVQPRIRNSFSIRPCFRELSGENEKNITKKNFWKALSALLLIPKKKSLIHRKHMSKTTSNKKLFHSFCNGRGKKEPVYDVVFIYDVATFMCCVKRIKHFIEEKPNHLSPSGLQLKFLVDFWTSHEFIRNVLQQYRFSARNIIENHDFHWKCFIVVAIAWIVVDEGQNHPNRIFNINVS